MAQDQKNIKYKIILAGLLHDIGKFWQRADKPRGQGSEVDDYNNNEPLLKHICPPKRNTQDYYPAYIHSLWTSKFFEENLNIFDQVNQSGELLFRVNIFDDRNQFIEDNVTNLAACHHNPHTFHQALIQLADWWSSGLDRRKAPTSDSEVTFDRYKDINFGKYPYRRIPLYSIFNMLHIKNDCSSNKEGEEQTKSNFGFRLSPLRTDETIFPYEIINENAQNELGYSDQWKDFVGEFQKLPTDSWKGFVTSLLYLLKKYTWCIPSTTPDLPYVSLYEHLKSTGGIAGCLYDYYLENKNAFISKGGGHSLSVGHDHEPLRLVSIDISGIQDFIYNIASAKAYRSLKGRSFYLTLLLDAVVTRFLNKIDHSPANVVYASGGKAFILAPNTQKTCDSIKKLQCEIEDEIFKEHHGRLYVSLASIPFSYQFSDKKDSNDAMIRSSHFDSLTTLGDLWTALIKKGDHIKNQKFKSLITSESGYNRFFSEKGLKGVESNPDKICAVTGELPNDGQKLKNIGGDNEVFVLPQVEKQTKLGEALKDGDYLFKYDKPTGEENTYLGNRLKVHIEPCNLGIHYYLIDESMLAENYAEFRSITSGDGTEVLRINNSDFLWTGKLKGNDASYGFLFYGGNRQPESSRINNYGKPYAKTFEELCEFKNNEDKIEETKLGVLRMDVDNLGKVFSSGFPNAYRSFAAYGTLSFMLDMFYSGYLNTIRYKYKDTVTIVYSGGDDVFAVGRWDDVIKFGMDVREDFVKFTGNPTLTLSGGMVMVNPSFPISKAADMAEGEEKKAKSGDKDAFVFFGERVQWGEEFLTVQTLKDQFLNLVTDHGLTRSLLHQMQKYKIVKDDGERQLCKGGKKDWSYKWHSAYHLGRYGQRYKNKKEVRQFVEMLSHGIMHNGKPDPDRYLDLVALAARWAEYELKINK